MAKRLQRRMARPTASAASKPGQGRDGGAGSRTGSRTAGRRRRISGQVVTEFTIQLATLSAAGIPIVRALTILERQTRPGPFKLVLGDLVEDVAGGTPLSEAMGKHERSFDQLYCSMVRAGEVGGVLDTVLQRLAIFREKAAEVRAKVVGALVYPVVVIAVALIVVSVVIAWVIPKFREIFQSFGTELPAITQLLLDLSRIATERWYLVFGVPILLLFLHYLGMRKPTAYRFRVHGLLLRVPVLGDVLTKSLIASFSRTFGTLIEAGVPHLDALAIVRDTSSSDVLTEAVEDIRVTVREGESIAAPMGEAAVFDDLVINMVDVGEETGELDSMLLRVADAYDVQVDRRIDTLFKVMEPLLLIVLAIFVGFIVVALFMPLMELMNTLQSQG